ISAGKAAPKRQKLRPESEGDGSADEFVQQRDGFIPRLLRVQLATVELAEGRSEDVLLDDRVIRALELCDNALGALGQDRTGGCVVEERVRRRVRREALLRLDGRGEVTGGNRLLDLLLGLRQPVSELGGCFLVLRSLGDREPCTPPLH